jgi:hypothetical protein
MAATAAQVCTLALQIAKAPNFTSQAGQWLNAILSDLCDTYDFDIAKKTFSFTFNPAQATTANFPNVTTGGGPYDLPADYLRAKLNDVMWFNQGVPYPLIPVDLAEFDWQVQQAGNQSFPYLWATDMSQSPPVAIVWPAPSGAYPVMVRYYSRMPDIATPETSATVPWFPNTNYLITRLAGELCKIVDDERWIALLGEGAQGAEGILRKYLNLKDDGSNRAKRVTLDRRRFTPSFASLPNTKQVGW